MRMIIKAIDGVMVMNGIMINAMDVKRHALGTQHHQRK